MASAKRESDLNAAREAMGYVRSYVPYGPANDPNQFLTADPDTMVRQLRAMGRLLATRDAIDRDQVDNFVHDEDNLRKMEIWAEAVRKQHGGNCGEQSALAFSFLRQRGVKPLDWEHFLKRDHAFVLIGRPSGSSAIGNPPQDWVQDLVICDPWKNRCGYLMDMIKDYPPAELGSIVYYNAGAGSIPVWKNK